jgi:predicted nucleic acid-binding protein
LQVNPIIVSNQPLIVVLDASAAIASIFSDEPLQLQALGLLDELERAGATLIAPPLWESETSSNVRLRVQIRKTLAPDDEVTSYGLLDALPVQIVSDDTRQLARDLAMQFSMVRCYDATYLALAVARGVTLWTADKRLFNTVSSAMQSVKFVGNWTSGAGATASNIP